jgi:hypothetical protein
LQDVSCTRGRHGVTPQVCHSERVGVGAASQHAVLRCITVELKHSLVGVAKAGEVSTLAHCDHSQLHMEGAILAHTHMMSSRGEE